MKKAIIYIKGILLGIVGIAVPGLSSSTIALSLNIYYDMIESISNIFKNPKKCIPFLIVLILGYGTGGILGALFIDSLYDVFPFIFLLLIMGFILGGFPHMFKEMKKCISNKKAVLTFLFMSVLICTFSFFVSVGTVKDFNSMQVLDYIILFFVGFITATTLVIPGVDFAVVLLSLGYYHAIVNLLSSIVKFEEVLKNGLILIIYLIGYGIGTFLFSKFIEKIYKTHPAETKFAGYSFLFCAPVLVLKNSIFDNANFNITLPQIIIGTILFLIGFVIIFILSKDPIENSRENKGLLRFYAVIIFHPIKAIYQTLKMQIASKNTKLTKQEKYDVARHTVEVVIKNSKASVQVFGLENIPEEDGFVMYSNHQGKFDGLAIVSALKRPISTVIDDKNAHAMMMNQFVNCTNSKRLKKDDPRQGIRLFKEIEREVIEEKGNFLIFPEGLYTDNKNTLLDFNTGCMRFVYHAKCPIIPICLYDTYKVFNVNSLKKVSCQVHFLEPILYDEYKDYSKTELANIIKAKIENKIEDINRTITEN